MVLCCSCTYLLPTSWKNWPPRLQCDQMVRWYFDIWSIETLEICPIAKTLAKVGAIYWQALNSALRLSTTFKIWPKWRIFANSGLTGTIWKTSLILVPYLHCIFFLKSIFFGLVQFWPLNSWPIFVFSIQLTANKSCRRLGSIELDWDSNLGQQDGKRTKHKHKNYCAKSLDLVRTRTNNFYLWHCRFWLICAQSCLRKVYSTLLRSSKLIWMRKKSFPGKVLWSQKEAKIN